MKLWEFVGGYHISEYERDLSNCFTFYDLEKACQFLYDINTGKVCTYKDKMFQCSKVLFDCNDKIFALKVNNKGEYDRPENDYGNYCTLKSISDFNFINMGECSNFELAYKEAYNFSRFLYKVMGKEVNIVVINDNAFILKGMFLNPEKRIFENWEFSAMRQKKQESSSRHTKKGLEHSQAIISKILAIKGE